MLNGRIQLKGLMALKHQNKMETILPTTKESLSEDGEEKVDENEATAAAAATGLELAGEKAVMIFLPQKVLQMIPTTKRL